MRRIGLAAGRVPSYGCHKVQAEATSAWWKAGWGAHLVSTTILKGWESLSPGLLGTSYPGEKSRMSSTLKELHQHPLASLVALSRCTPGWAFAGSGPGLLRAAL